MPSLPQIQSAISKLPNGPPIVAVLAGGTTGIGSYIANALATTFASSGDKLRVYIVGRNTTRAEHVINECRRISPGSEWRFVKASDLALVGEVDRCCTEIIRQETEEVAKGETPKVDLLYMTYSQSPLQTRSNTKEGLDGFLATVYYTRIRFIMQLLPLLNNSPLPSHVISVYAGTFEDGTKAGEFPIGCPPDAAYGIGAVRKHASFMKTFVFEELAERYAGKMRLTHIYPGLVDGPGFTNPEVPSWFKVLWRLVRPLLRFFMVHPETCGQIMLYLATENYPAQTKNIDKKGISRSSEGQSGGGAYSVGKSGDPQKGIMYERVRQSDTRKRVWDHTMETLEQSERAGKMI